MRESGQKIGVKMVNVCNTNLDEFMCEIEEKHLFVWGAGVRARRFFDECDIKNSLVAVVDNDADLQGKTFFDDGNKRIEIVSLIRMVKYIKGVGANNAVILITPVFHSINILEQLNSIAELSGVSCYISELLLNYYKEQRFDFTEGKPIIPKKIHYCWFGKKEIPENLKRYIDTWKKKCCDYEIIRWDESNYDVTKNKYVQKAYMCQKWGFVSDYARLDIIYNEGGIYLDTDVELLCNLDRFLVDEAFFGCSGELCINTGVGFGAIKRHSFIKELRDVYHSMSFCKEDGKMNLWPCTEYQHPVFKKHGFTLRNTYQNRNGIAIYPSEVFSPLGIAGNYNNFTKRTVSIHHGELSWISEEEHKGIEKSCEFIKSSVFGEDSKS